MTPFANPQTRFVPPAVTITNITNSNPCVITTATPHGYTNGIICTIVIPYPNVMEEIANKTYVMAIGSPTTLLPIVSIIFGTTFSTQFLDTTNLSPFSVGPLVTCIPHAPLPPIPFQVPGQKAQLVPSGEIETLENASDVIGPRNLP